MNDVFWKATEREMLEFFLSLTDEEAQAFLQQYVDRSSGRLALLKQTYRETFRGKEEDLDFSPHSLIPLWRWAAKRFRRREYTEEELLQIKRMPAWFGDHHMSNKPLAEESLVLVNDIAYYLADVLIRSLPDVRWEVCKTGVARYVDENQPVLSGFRDPVNPRPAVKVAALKAIQGTSGEDALLDVYQIYRKQQEMKQG